MESISIPFYSTEKEVILPIWGRFVIKRFQILLFVSIGDQRDPDCFESPIFPALFDTGNSLTLTVQPQQLKVITPRGMYLKPLDQTYRIHDASGSAQTAKSYMASVWIHNHTLATLPAGHIVSESDNNFRLKLSLAQDGIACVDPKIIAPPQEKKRKENLPNLLKFLLRSPLDRDREEKKLPHLDVKKYEEINHLTKPHLPLLGLRAICYNNLTVHLVCNRQGGYLEIHKSNKNIIIP